MDEKYYKMKIKELENENQKLKDMMISEALKDIIIYIIIAVIILMHTVIS